MAKIFTSYSHKQEEWVIDRLVPPLKAGGADVLIDRERFKLGKSVIGQMDAIQDQADKHLLVLSEDYLNSDYCMHELKRAIKLDPKFERGVVLPVLRENCILPAKITRPNPIYADLRDDKNPDPWKLLFNQCNADLGTAVTSWLKARDDTVRFLDRGESVNLWVKGNGVKWRAMWDHIADNHFPTLKRSIDLERGAVATRPALLAKILEALNLPSSLPKEPINEDLVEFDRIMSNNQQVARVAMYHFDFVIQRDYYDPELFGALRSLMESRKLTLLVQSCTPFHTLLPRDHPWSNITSIKTVELNGHS